MSSMNPNAANTETGKDPSAREGGDSSAGLQDPNKTETVSSEENLNQSNEEKEEEDCGECWFRRFLKKGGCKDELIEVDHCREGEDDGTKCRDARLKMNTCMYANLDYYGQYLVMQKAVLTQSLKEFEEGEKAAAAAKKKKEEEETKGN